MKPWTMVVSTDGRRVEVTFSGHLGASDGAESAEAFCHALGAAPRDVVWDVRAMSGYDGAARDAWAKALWPLRSAIRSLTVSSGNLNKVYSGKPYFIHNLIF